MYFWANLQVLYGDKKIASSPEEQGNIFKHVDMADFTTRGIVKRKEAMLKLIRKHSLVDPDLLELLQ